MTRNPNRGVVLALADAAALHRMLELWWEDRRFDNPIVAYEVKQQAQAAHKRLGEKLSAIFQAHSRAEA